MDVKRLVLTVLVVMGLAALSVVLVQVVAKTLTGHWLGGAGIAIGLGVASGLVGARLVARRVSTRSDQQKPSG